MIDATRLRATALQLIRGGRLPPRRPDRVWGGAGYGGSLCALCNSGIGHEEVAMEIEYIDLPDASPCNAYLHTHCFLALEQELLLCEAAGPAVLGRATDQPDPLATTSPPAAFQPGSAPLHRPVALPSQCEDTTMPAHGRGQTYSGGTA
jgi:hypothetical protein